MESLNDESRPQAKDTLKVYGDRLLRNLSLTSPIFYCLFLKIHFILSFYIAIRILIE